MSGRGGAGRGDGRELTRRRGQACRKGGTLLRTLSELDEREEGDSRAVGGGGGGGYMRIGRV